MQHAEQVRCSHRLLDNIKNARTDMAPAMFRHPVSDYTSHSQLQDEKAKLFKEQPVFVGFSSDLPGPGDYMTDTLIGVPVLIIRGQDGGLKAFVNMCSHRGAPVANGKGKGAKRFICPYHGWAYDAGGKFLRMTMESGFADMDPCTLGLRPLPAQEKYGLMWIGLHPETQVDVDHLLRDFKSDFASYGFESYHHYKTIPMHKRMNWKMVIDTFLENYHLKVLHKNSIAGAILSDLQIVDASGSCERLIQARSGFVTHTEQTPETEWDLIKHSAITYVLFPNTFFIMQSDHVEIWRSFPDGDNPDSSQIFFDVYVPQPAVTEKAQRYWDKNIDYGIAIVLDEDFPLSEKSQAAFACGLVSDITFGRNEPGLINYHKAINRALGLNEMRGVPDAPRAAACRP